MASNWQETYKKLKKRKEAIDKASNDIELNEAKQSYGRTGKSLYTGKAIATLNSNQTPSKKINTTKKNDNKIEEISKKILNFNDKIGNFIEDEIVEPIKDTKQNYQFGKLTEDLGMEAYKKMMGEDNEYDKIKKKYDEYITLNPELINDANLLDQTIQTLPNQVGALTSGIKGGGILGTVGAVGGAIIGGTTAALGTGGTGAGAGAIAGATTGAKWLGGTGYVTGSAEYTYKLEAGLQYQTLIEMGVPEDIAKEESKDTGAINALIEGGESILDLVTLGGLSAVKGALTKGLVKKYGEKTVTKWVGENIAKNAVSELVEESAQETVSIHNEKQAMERAGLERDDSQDLERIIQSGIAGGFAGGLIGGGTSVITGTTKAGINAIQNKNKAQSNVQIDDIAPIKQGEEIIQKTEQTTEDLEQSLRQQNYQYIPKDTDSIQRKTISEDASKYANNTTRTHEFVDFLVNVSEATGINFRLANNEAELIVNEKNKLVKKYANNMNVSLEEATKTLEKKTIDAYNNGNIVLNVDTPRALNRLVGHELNHSLEGTKEGSNLRRIAIEFAKTKNEYDSRIADLQAMYEGTNADIEGELVSDIVGDFLFTDQEFINNLHTQDRNLFQRIYDEVKHLIKMATAGSKEARQLEQLKHSFEKAMRENKTNTNVAANQNVEIVQNAQLEGEIGENISQNVQKNENIVQKEQVIERTTPSQEELDNLEDIRKNKSGSEYAEAFYSLEKKYGKKNLYKGLNSYNTTGKALKYSLSEIETYSKDAYYGQVDMVKEITNEKGEVVAKLEYSLYDDTVNVQMIEVDPNYRRKGLATKLLQDLQNERPDTEINFGYTTSDGTKLLENITEKIENPKYNKEKAELIKQYEAESKKYNDAYEKLNDKLREYWKLSQTRELTEVEKADRKRISLEQMEIMDKRSEVNEKWHEISEKATKGELKQYKTFVKTNNTQYSLSDNKRKKLTKEQQEFFKDSKVRDEKGNLLRVYHGSDNGDFTVFDKSRIGENLYPAYGEGFYFARSKSTSDAYTGKDGVKNIKTVYLNITNPFYATDNDIGKINVEELKKQGYDGVISGYGNMTEYVAFDSNQIKNIDNLNPTSDPDIRYSLSEDDYKMSHRPSTDYGDGSNFEENMPDVFEHPEWYMFGGDGWYKEAYMESWRALKQVRNNPEGEITIYRATIGDTINEGDWVSPSKKYAEWHNYSNLNDEGKIIELKVKAKDIRFAGDDLNEFGYFPNGVTDYSLSNFNSQDLPSKIAPTSADIFGSEIKLQKQVQEAIAPLQETIQELNNKITTLQENIAPIQGYTDEDISLSNQRNMESLEAQNIAPIEDASPDVMPTNEVVNDPFEDRDIKEVGNRKVKAYMYENPEVKPFFQQEARAMLGDLQNSIKGEKIWLQELNRDTGLYEESMVTGTRRMTTDDIAELLDVHHYTYAQIEKGLNAIIEDNGKENNAVSKRIEFMLNDRLLKGYKNVDGFDIPANEEYRALIRNKNIQEYTEQAYQEWNRNINQDSLVPVEDVSNTNVEAQNVPIENNLAPTKVNIPETRKQASNEPRIENKPKIKDTMMPDPIGLFRDTPEMTKTVEMKYTNKSSRVAKTKKQQLGDAWGKFREQFFNSFHYVDKFARDTGNQQIKFNADMFNNVYAEINGELTTAQTDNYGNPIGEALLAPIEEAKANGDYEALNDYIFNLSNIDRHRAKKGSAVPLNVSLQKVAEYEKTNPRLKGYAERYFRGYKNDLALMQSNGLISGQFNMYLQGMYPHYSPFMFDQDFIPTNGDDGVVRPNQVIKRAEGGAYEILDIEEARIRYTQKVRSAIRKNDLLKEIVDTSSEKIKIGADVRVDPANIDEGLGISPDGKYFATAFVDGEMQQAVISEDMYKELTQEGKHRMKALEDRYALITKPLQKLSRGRRMLLTELNPMFIATNFQKDVQDASFNSKYTKDFAKYYPTAAFELANAKTPLAKQFLTLYGSGNAYGEYNTDNITKGQKNSKFVKNVVNAVPKLNNLIELAPRFAEFKASIDNGCNIQEAMYNAREVTVNFGRGGYIAKFLNNNGFTFFNTSLQGFDKLARNFSGENGAKGVVGALSKVAILGVAPAVFNALAFGVGDDEDEDYKALPDYIKDNYYIFKTGDGEFIRIPKGRMLSIFGSAARRTMEYMQGEEDAFEGYLTNAYSQVGVQNPLESNIFAPLIQAKSNKTWYGTDLVPTRLQDKPAEEQYDESTDEFSKWLGQQLGISPYKINYVLDQYSGGIGDLLLPTITEEATSDGSFLAPIKDKFTANTTFDNKYVSEFYGTKDKLEVKANGSKASEEDLLKSKYMTSVSYEMSELYKEKREIQSNSDLTKQEKFRRVQEIQKQINSLAEEGLNNYENINKTSTYAMVGDREFYKDANDEWRNPYDDELEELNSLGMDIDDKSAYFEAKNSIYEINEKYRGSEDTYEDRKRDIIDVVRYSDLSTDYKSYLYGKYYSEDTTNIVNMLGINFDSYLDYESQYFVADKDEAGKSISGSKKKKVFDYINGMDIDFEEKVILAKLQYNSYDEWNYEIIDYLNNHPNISYDEEVFILKQLGFEVDNEGNIFWD